MFPEVGATELMVIAAVALIVVGPKDLPKLLHKLGQFMARMRGMANEFRASFDEMARQSELDELRKEVQALRTGQYLDTSTAAVTAHSAEVKDVFYEIEQDLRTTQDFGPASPDGFPEIEPAPLEGPVAEAAPAELTPKPPAKPRAKRKPKAGLAAPEAES